MRAIILAAGRGSRLKDLTKNKPKSFLKIKNRRMIDYQIEGLKKNGIKDIAAVVGYKKEMFRKLKIKLFNNKNWESTNMVYSLFKANSWLSKYDCIICYGDIFYDNKIITKLIQKQSQFTLPSNKNWKRDWELRYKNPLSDLETFKIDKNQILKEIGNKPKKYSEIQGQFMGLIKLNKHTSRRLIKIYDNFSQDLKNNLQFTHFLDICVRKFKIKIDTFSVKDYWFELDNKTDLKVIKKNY
jgi:L-glutamine-phosphate cytidylyltransferase